MDVCVVGAGIIGAATAYHLSRLGARVTIVDATDHPQGASAATFGWINANGKQPEHYFDLNRAAMAEHEELARALGDSTWLHGGGSLEWADADGISALRARVADHAAREYPAEMIDSVRLQELEPALQPDPMPAEAAFFPTEGWADTVQLIGLLLAAAEDGGAVIRRPLRANEIQHDGRAFVVTDSGDRIAADVVVNCAGAEASSLVAEIGVQIETAGPPGLNAVTMPTPIRLNRIVRAPGVHFRPETGGRVMIASPSSDKALGEGTDPLELAARNIEAAVRHAPGLVGLAVQEARVARRAVPPDGMPVIGRLPDSAWVYHVVAHSGVTLAPLLGRLVAEEIVKDTEAVRLAPFRPARFAGR